MKTKLLFFALIATTLISCNEKRFANKVMKDIGSGVYASPLCEGRSIYPLDIFNHSDVFDLSEIYNQEAKKRSKIEDFEIYFQTNILFNEFTLIESIHSNIDLLSYNVCDSSYGKDLRENWYIVMGFHKADDKNFIQISDNVYIGTQYKMIDNYFMKYKISSNDFDKIAYLNVIKIPKKGYRVTSFIII